MLSHVRALASKTKPLGKILATQSNQVISSKQQLYVTDPVTPGSVFFLPHGTRIFNKLVTFMKQQQIRYGFSEVITPLIYKSSLWKTSGHWDNYKEDMFRVVGHRPEPSETMHGESDQIHNESEKTQNESEKVQSDDTHSENDQMHEYGLKPMNCPGHCVLYSKLDHSHADLPVRYSDFLALHRNEATGALLGLTRVRRFHQDDGHIFCTLAQVGAEIEATLALIRDTYRTFGLDVGLIELHLLTRPEKFVGLEATWAAAEAQLAAVLERSGSTWGVREGDGAFYGPKIDVLVADQFGKRHQLGTVQLDFQLPSRFALRYRAADGLLAQPIMVHRAVFGSLERFFAILLDHYQGRWPFWLSPRQCVVVPVSSKTEAYAQEVQRQLAGDVRYADVAPLTGHHFHVDVDARSEPVGARIREALGKGYSFVVVVGEKEQESGTVLVRTLASKRLETVETGELYRRFVQMEREYK